MSFQKGEHGQNCVQLTAPDGSSVTVTELGAHVTSWKTANGVEQLYTSPKAIFDGKTAIRGGAPIIFPQFSDMGPGPVHGVARVRPWILQSVSDGVGTFLLKIRKDDPLLPGSHVDVSFTVSFSNTDLHLRLFVKNLDSEAPFSFNVAFHTYFRVSHIQQVQVNGLDRFPYANNLEQRKMCDPSEIRVIDKEVDRIYFHVSNPVVVNDISRASSFVISGNSMPDVVLWNPWVEKAKKMSKDLPEDGYNDFVCVEHGQIQEKIVVGPGKEWSGSQDVVVKQVPSKI
jgi:glucose-6-phosphate 1-epimerase